MIRNQLGLHARACALFVKTASRFKSHVFVPETLTRTTLGGWRAGDAVNLERPLRLDQRLGGHLVQGHVDGVGIIETMADEGEGKRLALRLPKDLARYVAEKGSIAVAGTSRRVAADRGERCVSARLRHTPPYTGAGSNAPAPPGTGKISSLELVSKLAAKGANLNARTTRSRNIQARVAECDLSRGYIRAHYTSRYRKGSAGPERPGILA